MRFGLFKAACALALFPGPARAADPLGAARRAWTEAPCVALRLTTERGLFLTKNALRSGEKAASAFGWSRPRSALCGYDGASGRAQWLRARALPASESPLSAVPWTYRYVLQPLLALAPAAVKAPAATTVRGLPAWRVGGSLGGSATARMEVTVAAADLAPRTAWLHEGNLVTRYHYEGSLVSGDLVLPQRFETVLTDQKAKATAVTRVLSFTTDCREVAAFLAECEGLAGQDVAEPREAAPTYLAPAKPRRLPDHGYPYAAAYDTVPRAARAPAKAIGPAGIPAYAWRGFVSRVDGSRCPHYPTCSQYCLLSIKRHGLFGGLVRTAARLLGEYGAIETDGRKPFVLVHDRWRLFDPPQAEPQVEKE